MLNLSDSFESDIESDIDLRVRMININFGHNKELLNNCKPLRDYAKFIYDVRRINKDVNDIRASIDIAFNEMDKDSVLKNFLLKNKAEVMNMCITEYDEAKHLQTMKDEFEIILERLRAEKDEELQKTKNSYDEELHREKVNVALKALKSDCSEELILTLIDNNKAILEEAKHIIDNE